MKDNEKKVKRFRLLDLNRDGKGVSKADAKKAVDAFVSTVTDALKEGDKIALVGFGTFSVSQKAARKGVNPATGATIEIAAKNVAKFKPGAELAEAVK